VIKFRQGETVEMDFDVVDSAGVAISLVGASSVMAYKPVGGEVVVKACVIGTGKVTTTFTEAETKDMLGTYLIEVKLKDSANSIDSIYYDKFEVSKSLIPEFPVVV